MIFSINSAVNDGEMAVYDEACSSIVASTFSSGRVGARSRKKAQIKKYILNMFFLSDKCYTSHLTHEFKPFGI